jgi:hypothetical protein
MEGQLDDLVRRARSAADRFGAEVVIMAKDYNAYYSAGSYDELHDGRIDYDQLASGGKCGPYRPLESVYGSYDDFGYRREHERYRPRDNYDSYRVCRGYRSGEAAFGYDRNYARDNVRLRVAQEKPGSFSKAAGR